MEREDTMKRAWTRSSRGAGSLARFSLIACGLFAVCACSGEEPPSEQQLPATERAQKAALEGQGDDKEEASDEAGRPSGRSGTGLVACDLYLETFEDSLRCPQIPEALRATTQRVVDETRSSWEHLIKTGGAEAEIERACEEATEGLREGAAAFGCTI